MKPYNHDPVYKYLGVLILASGLFGNTALARQTYFDSLDSQCTALNGAGSVRNSAVTCSTSCHGSDRVPNSVGTAYANAGHNVTAAISPTLCTAPTNAAPVVNTISDVTGTINVALPTINVSATNETDQQLTFTATGLPAGVTLTDSNHTDKVATIGGTPTVAGTFTVKVTATDNGSPPKSGSATFTLTVNDPQSGNTAPVLDIIGDRTYPVNKALSFKVSATDSNAQDTLTFSATGLPAGVHLTDNGDKTATISGTPTTVGVYSSTVKVTDSGNLTDSETFNFTVQTATPPPGDYTHKLQSEAKWVKSRKELRFTGKVEPIDGDDDDDDDSDEDSHRNTGVSSAKRDATTCSAYQGMSVVVTNASGRELAKPTVNCDGNYRAAVKQKPEYISCSVNAVLKDGSGAVVEEVRPETGIRVENSPARNCRNDRDRRKD